MCSALTLHHVLSKKRIMKTTILFLATVCLLAGCKKTATPPGGIIGKWELRKSYGGFAYHDSTFLAGNGTIYQFNPDSTYRFYVKNKLTKQGSFHTRTDHQDVSGTTHQILFSDGTGQPFDLQGSRLTLGTTVTDGIAMDYQKIL